MGNLTSRVLAYGRRACLAVAMSTALATGLVAPSEAQPANTGAWIGTWSASGSSATAR